MAHQENGEGERGKREGQDRGDHQWFPEFSAWLVFLSIDEATLDASVQHYAATGQHQQDPSGD